MFLPMFALVFVVTLAVGLFSGPRKAVVLGWLGTAYLLPYWFGRYYGYITE